MQPIVSIVVPVFNVEDYLSDCLKSLIEQTYKDIEILCVIDAASSDKSDKILKDFADKDSRIKIILQNDDTRLSGARNIGTKAAIGKYISYMDSDDWADEDYIEKLVNAAEKYDADVAAASIIRYRKNYQKYRVKFDSENVYTELHDKIKACNIPNCCYVWNKIYRTDLVKEAPFKEGVYFEDIFWSPDVIKRANKLVTVPGVNYYYRVRPTSTVKVRQTPQRQRDSYCAKRSIIRFFDQNNLPLSKKERTVTKHQIYIGNFVLMKIKEYNDIETGYLFNILPVYRKKVLSPIIKDNTFLVWEPCSKSHSEIVPGYAKYLLDLGYEVSAVVNPMHIKDGLFSRFKNDKLFVNKLSRKEAKNFFKKDSLENAKGILVTTAGKICDNIHFEQSFEHFAPDFDRSKLFLVEHDAKFAIDENLWDKNIITLRKLNYKGQTSTVINPHYFGEVKITPKNDITNFVMVGSLSYKKMTQNVVIDAIKELVDSGYTNFKLTAIGKGSLKNVPKEIKKYIDLKGRLPFDKMYDELEKADFILTSYNPQSMHIFYNTTGTSGSFQLVYGFLKPCVILEEFAGVNDFTNDNAILYKNDNEYSKALIRGIEMSKEDYQKMQNNLKEYANNLYKTSLENFKNLIEGRKNG